MTPEQIEELKQECCRNIAGKYTFGAMFTDVDKTLDYLASNGYLREPVEPIDGLDDWLRRVDDGIQCNLPPWYVTEAARRYAAMTKGAGE